MSSVARQLKLKGYQINLQLNDRDKNEEKSIAYSKVVIFVILTLLIFNFEKPLSLYYYCKDLENFRKETFNGYITEKYIDLENHAIGTIIINGDETFLLSRDTSSFYDFITQGDLINKPLGYDSIYVRRQDQVYSFKIHFGCE